MGSKRRHSLKSSVSLGLTVLVVCFGCSSAFTASEGGTAGDGAEHHAGAANAGNGSGAHSGMASAGSHSAGSHSAGSNSAGDGASGASTGGSNSAGQSAGGSGGTSAGNGGAGGSIGGSGNAGKGGTASGGTMGNAGHAGHGGASAGNAGCSMVVAQAAAGAKGTMCGECLIANQCVDQCGGTLVYTGCCACPPCSVNKLTCTGL
jgi:hypothetical protein